MGEGNLNVHLLLRANGSLKRSCEGRSQKPALSRGPDVEMKHPRNPAGVVLRQVQLRQRGLESDTKANCDRVQCRTKQRTAG